MMQSDRETGIAFRWKEVMKAILSHTNRSKNCFSIKEQYLRLLQSICFTLFRNVFQHFSTDFIYQNFQNGQFEFQMF